MRAHGPHVTGNCPALFSGRSSRVYDFLARRVLRRLYRHIADDLVAELPQNAEVLDVGTGPGVLLVELARRRADLRLVGVDLSADMVAAATRNIAEFADRASARVGDVVELPFDDGSFDVVVSSLSMHHWDHPDAAVPELARVLRAAAVSASTTWVMRPSTSSPKPPVSKTFSPVPRHVNKGSAPAFRYSHAACGRRCCRRLAAGAPQHARGRSPSR